VDTFDQKDMVMDEMIALSAEEDDEEEIDYENAEI
jgi:hypothetical protein